MDKDWVDLDHDKSGTYEICETETINRKYKLIREGPPETKERKSIITLDGEESEAKLDAGDGESMKPIVDGEGEYPKEKRIPKPDSVTYEKVFADEIGEDGEIPDGEWHIETTYHTECETIPAGV